VGVGAPVDDDQVEVAVESAERDRVERRQLRQHLPVQAAGCVEIPRAHAGRGVSLLELELQANVSKDLVLSRFLARGEFYWKSLVKAWFFCWPQILFGKTAKLWVPVPGIATHWCAGLFSPGFDWISFMRSEASCTETLPTVETAHPTEVERIR